MKQAERKEHGRQTAYLQSLADTVTTALIVVGALIALIGAFSAPKSFGYAYLVAYIFFFSLALGSMFLVLLHHLFDASWSVPIRRVAEHNACLLFPVMAILPLSCNRSSTISPLFRNELSVNNGSLWHVLQLARKI